MRIGVVSDVHANLEALDAVLAHLQGQSPDLIVCLGDFVGYGPNPNECVERLQPLLRAAVVGNHDQAALGDRPIDDFNLYAQAAIVWTRGVLADAPRGYLAALPIRDEIEGLLIVHGSPRSPVDEYIVDTRGARASLLDQTFRIALVGHTHQPAVYEESNRRTSGKGFLPEVPVALNPSRRYIINVGSVGQPRDSDPRAAYGLIDLNDHTATLHRVAYAIEDTQRKMEAAELPVPLIERLALGR